MHYCERCGDTYNATVAESARNCPKCSAEGEKVPLRFRLFEPSALRVAGISTLPDSARDAGSNTRS